MTPACSSISLFPSAQTKNTRDGPTAAFPKDSILIRMGKPRIQPTISFVISFIPAWAGKTRSIDSRQDSKHSSSPLTQGKLSQCNRQRLLARLIPAHAGKTLRGCGRGGLRGGSSPLTRGKHGYSGRVVSADRLIPAHAGKTRCPPGRDRACPAHPRSRGENFCFVSELTPEDGSSPLTRGKRISLLNDLGQVRLIPAHAGKTRPCCSRTPPYGAHPRSRGENLGRVGRVLPVRGLIPAHAGKTSSRQNESKASQAHPRSRGENCVVQVLVAASAGSSPLTRGKHPAPHQAPTRRRLIPAHAGKTRQFPVEAQSGSAHPRSRGENHSLALSAPYPTGSSPLTRGKLFHGVSLFRHCRLIPAHAGKTTPNQRLVRIAQAHPRSRGENDDSVAEEPELLGSSPLTRGKRALRR